MKIAWFLGFGWAAIATLVASGIAINMLEGPVRWVLYVPFLLAGLHMTIRFRAFTTQRWRRIHARHMIDYGKFAEREYEVAKKENRDFNIETPCRQLAQRVFPGRAAEELAALVGDDRVAYYGSLVQTCPQVFLEGIAPERQSAVLEGVQRDVAASELGPDIVIAKQIELKHNGLEAARYLQALLLGQVR
jgi:hypothetical protein